MKRRDFLKTGAVAVGADGFAKDSADARRGRKRFPKNRAPPADNRPAEYLHRVQGDRFLPKPPVPARSYEILPMPLAERVRRKIVPQRGFCSIAPGDLVSESSHLRQWRDEHRVDGRSLRGANPFPPRKPAHAVEAARWRLPRLRTFFRKCGNWCWTGNTAKPWRSLSRT